MIQKNSTAIVTGGSRGIGRAISLALAERGVKVLVNHAREGSADEVLGLIKENGGTAEAFQADIAQEDQVQAMVRKAADLFGRVDFLINNAGISDQIVPIVDQDSRKWQEVIDIHLKGTYLCSKEAAPYMIKNNFGRIINIASVMGLVGFPLRTAYGPAKSAIIQLTRVLALEWPRHNINVNAVAPGYIRTELVEDLIKAGKLNEKALLGRIPAKRMGAPEEVAEVVMFLLSEAANYITGTTIAIDGGWTAYGYI